MHMEESWKNVVFAVVEGGRTGSQVTARMKLTTTRVASMSPKDCTAGTGEKMLAAKANADVVDLHVDAYCIKNSRIMRQTQLLASHYQILRF
jgi:hypothetical protein